MKIENIRCEDSNVCSNQYKISRPDIISIVHGQGAHIILTKDDYDVIKEGSKTSFHLSKKTCLELSTWGVFHHWNGMTENEINDFKQKIILKNTKPVE